MNPMIRYPVFGALWFGAFESSAKRKYVRSLAYEIPLKSTG